MSDELVRIAANGFAAAIHPHGAELWSLQDPCARELMTDADPAYWPSHAPLLFPIVGTLAGNSFRLDGQAWPMERHGLARRNRFDLIHHAADQATFRLTDNEATRAIWPFGFTLDMDYRLACRTLHQTATVTANGERAMPFSIGFHHAFAWPLPFGGAKAEHRICFAEPEPAPVRRVNPATGLLLPAPQPSPVAGRKLPVSAALFEPDVIIWDQLASRSLLWGAPGYPQLKIDFPGMERLGLWQKPGANFLCIEPWAGIADETGFDGEIYEKPGIMLLQPGAARAFRMDVTLVD